MQNNQKKHKKTTKRQKLFWKTLKKIFGQPEFDIFKTSQKRLKIMFSTWFQYSCTAISWAIISDVVFSKHRAQWNMKINQLKS